MSDDVKLASLQGQLLFRTIKPASLQSLQGQVLIALAESSAITTPTYLSQLQGQVMFGTSVSAHLIGFQGQLLVSQQELEIQDATGELFQQCQV